MLGIAAICGAAIGAASVALPTIAPVKAESVVVDGDTLRIGKERVRLLGIDAPELHGCPRTRTCAPGDGQASKAALARQIGGREVRITRVGKDRYGRTLAVAHVGEVNLSCAQLADGQAIYKSAWDNGRRIWRACPSAAR